MDAQSDTRLRLAFRGEEPGGDRCEDDDYEADEDAPATGREAVSNVFALGAHEKDCGVKYPFAIIVDL